MFNRDHWEEIFLSIRKNRLRTFLTAFSVSWGIFILMILLGSGTGLQNGAKSQFLNDAINTIWINGGVTSMPYEGMKPGREIRLTNGDVEAIKTAVPDYEFFSANFDMGSKIMSYKNERSGFLIRGCLPDHLMLENGRIVKGRFLHALDQGQRRKVCVIGKNVEEALFRGTDPLGKWISSEGNQFLVVGVFDDPGRGDLDRIYIPLSTAQAIFSAPNEVDVIWFTTGNASMVKSRQMLEEARRVLAFRHRFDSEDQGAIWINNKNEEYKRIMSLLNNIRIFVWIIGIGTLIAGIVGVSNIMLIVVKERTREIAIRKAIGAKPVEIVRQIILESLFITGTAGMVGLIAGVWLLEGLRELDINSEYFKDPAVHYSAALGALIVLVISGSLAGLLPALRASTIEITQALKDA